MEQPERPAGGEIRALTGLRFVAAVWVVAHHYWLFSGAPWLRNLEPLRPLLADGWLGVDLFFVLSGFVLAHNYVAVLGSRPGLWRTGSFYWARLSRIWPTWMVVLTAATCGLLVERLVLGRSPESRLDLPTMLRSVLLVQVWDRPDYAATGPVGPGWSLSAEWLAYLAFPALVLVLYRLRRRSPVVLGALSLGAVAPFAVGCLALGTHDWRWSWLLRLAGAFLAGELVASCVARIRRTVSAQRAAAAVATVVVVLLVVVLWTTGAAGTDRGGAAVLLFPVLVGALAVGGPGPGRWLSRPLVVLGGRISFALYLVHMSLYKAGWTLTALVPALRGGSVGTVLAELLVAASPIPVAWVLWRVVEEPARRRMRALDPFRRAPRRRPAEPAAAPVLVEVGRP